MSDLPTSDYVPERGYFVGPSLPVGADPWPLLWEQREGLDDCPHTWERVTVNRRFSAPEAVVRCRTCLVPRCGHSDERNPCMERRHHRTVHIRLSGDFEPVGGYLRDGSDK